MDNLRREFDAAWADFRTLDSLRLIPETIESEWTRGRDTYLAFLISLDDLSAVSHLRNLVRQIETIPGVEPYPEDYWHITIKGIGFEVPNATRPDDLRGSEVQRIAKTARAVFATQPAFEVRLGLAGGFPEVVIAEVWDSLPVRDLNCRLLEAAPGLIRYPFDGPNFLPHVSIARFASDERLTGLKETLSRLRQSPPGPAFTVREVRFIRAQLSERTPSFQTIETYALTTDN